MWCLKCCKDLERQLFPFNNTHSKVPVSVQSIWISEYLWMDGFSQTGPMEPAPLKAPRVYVHASYKWDDTACTVWCPASISQHTFGRFIHVAVCWGRWLIFLAIQYSNAWEHYTQPILLLLGFWVIINSAAMNILVPGFSFPKCGPHFPPTSSVREVRCSTSSPTRVIIFYLFCFSFSGGCVLTSHCGLYLHFPVG